MERLKRQVWNYWEDISIFRLIIGSIAFLFLILWLDINDIVFQMANRIGENYTMLFLVCVLVIIVSVLSKRHFFDLLKIPCGNIMDETIYIISIVTVLSYVFVFHIRSNIVFVVIPTFIFMISRIIFCGEKEDEKKNSSIDLKQFIFEEKNYDSKPLIFVEEASDYDLLGREGLIELIYASIKAYKYDHVHVIGLKGAWGSGKTTILNNVISKIEDNNDDIILIKNFDPWIFGNQESMLVAMYDEILNGINVKYSTFSSRAMINSLKDVIADTNKSSRFMISFTDVETSDYVAVKHMRQRLSKLLNKVGKEVVFVIDNIDRANADNIIFLFKLIGSVFNLPNLIYLLSYDDERIEEVFSDSQKINPKYIEKIIQQEVVVPDIHKEKIEKLCNVVIEKTLKIYGIKLNEINRYSLVSDYICDCIEDLRQFKRLLNSAFVTTFYYDNILYKPHLLFIESIRFIEPILYEEIKHNKKYFVSLDSYYLGDLNKRIIDKKQFQKETKEYFDELFEEYNNYDEILSTLFPRVREYLNGFVTIDDYGVDNLNSEHNRVASIASGKYFDLYFSYGSNDFIKINNIVEKFVERINTLEIKEILSFVKGYITEISRNIQKEWFEQLQNMLNSIVSERRVLLAEGIIESLDKIDSTISFGFLRTSERALFIAVKLLRDVDDLILKKYVDSWSDGYNIILLDKIIHNCDALIKSGDSNYNLLKKISLERCKKLYYEIIDNKINIFNDDYYRRGNVFALYRISLEDNIEILHEYMLNIISPSNVINIMSEMVVESFGNMGYGYRIDSKYVDCLFGSNEIVEKMVNEIKPTTYKEEFLLGLWDRMKNDDGTNPFDDFVYYPEPINF